MSFQLKLNKPVVVDPNAAPEDLLKPTPADATFATEAEALAEVKKRWPSATCYKTPGGTATYVFDKAFWDARWASVPESHRPACAMIVSVVDAPQPQP